METWVIPLVLNVLSVASYGIHERWDETPSPWDKTASAALNFLAKVVLRVQDNYEVILHSYGNYENDPFLTNFQVKVLLKGNYWENWWTYRLDHHPSKRRIPISIIVGPSAKYSHTMLAFSMGYLVVTPFNLAIFTTPVGNAPNAKVNTFTQRLPITKMIFDSNRRNGFSLTILRGGFGKAPKPPLELFSTPWKLHKHQFWKRSSPVIQAMVYFPERSGHGTNIFKCPIWLRKRSIEFNHCSHTIMATVYLAHEGNLTLDVYHLHERRRPSTQFLYTDYNQKGYSDIKIMTGFYFSYFSGLRPNYCRVATKVRRSILQVSLWTEPFTLGAWSCVLLTLLMLCLFQYSSGGKLIQAMISMAAVLLSQSTEFRVPNKLKGFMISTYFIFFFVSNLYTNGITSIIVVPKHPQIYKSLLDMLNDQYKILYFSANGTLQVPMEKRLNSYFTRNGIGHLLNSTFRRLSLDIEYEISPWNVAPYLSKKYLALTEDDGRGKFTLVKWWTILNHIEYKMGSRKRWACYVVDDLISESPVFWMMYIMNRHWLAETLMRIQQSGLNQHNAAIADWTTRLEIDYNLQDPSFTKAIWQHDEITMVKIYPVLVMSGVILFWSVLFLIGEMRLSFQVVRQRFTQLFRFRRSKVERVGGKVRRNFLLKLFRK